MPSVTHIRSKGVAFFFLRFLGFTVRAGAVGFIHIERINMNDSGMIELATAVIPPLIE